MSFGRSVLAGMAGDKSGRPQFVGITKLLRLATGQRNQPSPGLERDCRLPARTRAIVERRHRAFDHGALDAALDRLMVQPQRPADRKKRRIYSIFEPHTDLIKRGKVRTPVEFGHKVFLAESAGGCNYSPLST
jgi:hypothetical protein